MLVGEHNPEYLEFIAFSDIRPTNKTRIFEDERKRNPASPRKGFKAHYGSRAGDIKFYEKYEELLANKDIQAIVIALPLGIASALFKDGLFDQITRFALMVTLVMPAFWVGILLLTYFSVKLQLFPVAGYGEGWREHLHHLFLPALTVALSIVPLLVRALRASILEAMGSEYVRTARAKGLRNWMVVVHHAVRNALIPVVTIIALNIPIVLGGAVITEQIFRIPGIGSLLVQGIYEKDVPVVMAVAFGVAILVVIFNIIADVVYALLDPRIKFS